jgi:hypothetical protein
MPRWFTISLVAVGALVLLALAVFVIVGGDHGPARHMGWPAS